MNYRKNCTECTEDSMRELSARDRQRVRRSMALLGPVRIYRDTVVITHPPEASPELMELLDHFRGLGIRVNSEPGSAYDPDCYFSVVMRRPENEAIAQEYLDWARKRWDYHAQFSLHLEAKEILSQAGEGWATASNEERLSAMLESAQKELERGVPCILCGGVSTHVGVFTYAEHFARRIGRKSEGVAAYLTCYQCLHSPMECATRAEEKIVTIYQEWQRSIQ